MPGVYYSRAETATLIVKDAPANVTHEVCVRALACVCVCVCVGGWVDVGVCLWVGGCIRIPTLHPTFTVTTNLILSPFRAHNPLPLSLAFFLTES
jgi:hypothetical protein